MLRLNNPGSLSQRFCQFWSQRTGKGYVGATHAGLVVQVQSDYLAKGISFQEKEIPAQIDDYICSQMMSAEERSGNCSERNEGLGDWIHNAIAPIVNYSDQHFGTQLATCGGCAERRKKLNVMVPFN